MTKLTVVLLSVLLVSFLVDIDAFQRNKDHNDYVKNPHPIVCYFGSWAHYHQDEPFDIEDINYNLCTHINYGFAKIDEYTYEILVFDPWLDEHLQSYQRFVDLKKKNPNLTTMISLGGWYEGSEKYSDMVTNAEIRHKFVRSVIAFLGKYNFDGLDLDWEYPGNRGGANTDKDNYIQLLTELRAAFEPHGYLLTAALSPGKQTIDSAYIVPKLNELLDWANVMAYDYHGGWEGFLGHNSPLFSRPDETDELSKKYGVNFKWFTVDYTIHYFLSLGLSKDKMVMGVPFYGRAWTLLNETQVNIHDYAKGMAPAGKISHEPGVLGYDELCLLEKQHPQEWHNSYDKYYMAPYAWTKDIFIGFDNEDSIQCKIAFLKLMGLKGAMIWSLENDDFKSRCGSVKYPLLRKVHSMLNGDEIHSMECKYGDLFPTTPKPTSPPTTTTTTPKPTPPPTQPTTEPPLPTTSKSPIDYWCSKDGYMPDSTDPHVFYQCEWIPGKGWWLHKMVCPGATKWNQDTLKCDK